jgi:predicted ATP-grasp superfamily ATP-dependent carboligase
MDQEEHLIIVGASARAAAFSALRAGLRPWCVDLFGDVDLRARCPVTVIPRQLYPHGLLDVVRGSAPEGSLMYTGGLENHPEIVRRLAECRPLVGNEPEVLRRVRDPWALAEALPGQTPRIEWDRALVPRDGTWLAKPRRGSGGSGIEPWTDASRPRRGTYFQEIVSGLPIAAIYDAPTNAPCRFLGATQQLVGQAWLHARPFAYCGSIGPLTLASDVLQAFEGIGQRLQAAFHLRGLFGVDAILQDNLPLVLEVNPRYTASVEVLEYAALSRTMPIASEDFIGKAILFARGPISFSAWGPWDLDEVDVPAGEMPAYADIPMPGTEIDPGQPVLSFFVRGGSTAECLQRLQNQAATLDRLLLGS